MSTPVQSAARQTIPTNITRIRAIANMLRHRARCLDEQADKMRPGDTAHLDASVLDDWRACISCHEPFVLRETEIQFYLKNDLSVPRRCGACRLKRRDAKQAALATATVQAMQAAQ